MPQGPTSFYPLNPGVLPLYLTGFLCEGLFNAIAMDIIFLLSPGFKDPLRDTVNKQYYCPDCAFLEGVLSYYPWLREKLDLRYIDYAKPRAALVAVVGDQHQGCPNLVLDPENVRYVEPEKFFRFADRVYTNDTRLIVKYLRDRYGIGEAHY